MTTPPRDDSDPGLIGLSSKPPEHHEEKEVWPTKAPASSIPEDVKELLEGPLDDHDLWNQEQPNPIVLGDE